ncbi:hypothetical protein E2562_000967 [Oryza meyeriana var. granulata]|uniref:FBD domain-containing protein n=1 Tax=Oryza meyeriana var. granulata TaxID=110450 RepID=A0A6G1CYH6_9ORYZ|nr:hypothetical protein E2562_000967 [Oryza meyeriana var. granulata]
MLDKELFNEIIEERGAFELPCFTSATKILLDLGFLGLSLPPSGVFPTLRELHLVHVQFHGEFTLDDTMMPFLEGLGIYSARGLASLTLRLKRLIWMNLFRMRGLLWLNAVVPGLKALSVCYCFRSSSRQIGLAGVCIVAEELVVLKWIDWYCPICVNFNQMPRLQMLSVSPFYPFGRHNMFNPSCDWLLKLFPRIHGLQMLVQYACPPNCICDRPPNWRDEDISLEALREVEILNFRGKKPELDLLRIHALRILQLSYGEQKEQVDRPQLAGEGYGGATSTRIKSLGPRPLSSSNSAVRETFGAATVGSGCWRVSLLALPPENYLMPVDTSGTFCFAFAGTDM